MAINLGTVKPGSTIYIPFNTFDSNDPSASVAVAALVAGDIEVYKNGSVTQRASDSGYTLLDTDGIDFDGHVGIGGFSIDLADNSTAGFWASGARYFVVLGPVTVDTAVINFVPVLFDIGYSDALLNTTIISLTSATQFILTDGPAEANVLIGCPVLLHDVASKIQFAFGVVSNYIVTTKEVFLSATPVGFTPVATDNIAFFMPSNVGAISGDKTAADNLKDTYNGTGYDDDQAPAKQSQVSAISNTGSAVNRTAASYVLTTGTQSANTVASVEELDGTRHEHTDDAGAMDLYYEFLIGAGIPSACQMTGYLLGSNDDLEVYGYDWVAASFKRIGEVRGLNAATNRVFDFDMFVDMVGSGSDFGKVRVQFTDGAFTLTSATLAIDQLFVAFSQQSGGYDNGAVWFDSNRSNTNTVPGTDGITTNAVSTIGAVNTLLASQNLNRVEVAPNSSVTFAAAQENQEFTGKNWALALGGQSISNSHITGAEVSGIGTGALHAHFDHCEMGDCTLDGVHIDASDLEGDLTLVATTTYYILGCYHTAGNAPIIDFGAAIGNTTVHIHDYHGAIEIKNMGQNGTDVLHFSSGDGKLILGSTNIGGTLNRNGTFAFVNNSTGMTINSEGAVIDLLPLALVAGRMDSDIGAKTGDVPLSDQEKLDVNAQVDIGITDAALATASNLAIVDGIVDSILVDTNTTIPALISALNDLAASDILTTALTEAYAADGVAPTLSELMFLLLAVLTEMTYAGTTATAAKLDGVATAAVFALDDGADPTSITRTA